MAVSRESIGTLTAMMGAMIHPLVVVPFGIFATSLSEGIGFCKNKLFGSKLEKIALKINGVLKRVFARLFVMTFNAYLSLVGIAMYYLFRSSVSYRKSSDVILVAKNDYKGLIFNKCMCNDTIDEKCLNNDTNFQNLFSIVPNEIMLLIFVICPMAIHILHSLMVYSSKPVTLVEFILGSKMVKTKGVEEPDDDLFDETESISANENTIEDHDSNGDDVTVLNNKNSWCTKKVIFQYACCFLSIAYVIGIIFTPYFFVYMFEIREREAGM